MLTCYSNKQINKQPQNKQILLKRAIQNYPAKTRIFIPVDDKGNPTDIFWRRRLKDEDLEFIQKEDKL